MRTNLSDWARYSSRPEVGLDVLRIYLGAALVARGIMFTSRPQQLVDLIHTSGDWFMPLAVLHAVALAHFCGGLLLGLGLATRWAAALQVPVLAGAVFFHWGDGLLRSGQSLELSALVLAMLVVYTVCGSGPLSVDALLRERQTSNDTLAPTPNVRQALPRPH